ncbi:hypothetical protein [Weissella confusa]|uniref:hypothetical protein n=1 Tax=Weissella confusa TaxID=1583 RepID=UPI0022E38C3F|nr:hypothetical protein [Weissella confusa]
MGLFDFIQSKAEQSYNQAYSNQTNKFRNYSDAQLKELRSRGAFESNPAFRDEMRRRGL